MERLLQIAGPLSATGGSDTERFTRETALLLGGAVLSLAPSAEEEDAEAARIGDSPVYFTEAGEDPRASLSRVLEEVQPRAVLVQDMGDTPPGVLEMLPERGIPYAVYLHDFGALCPTRRLWERPQHRCDGPSTLGMKCARCVGGGKWLGADLPLRVLFYKHRPEGWRMALGRAQALVASSRYARDFWIEQGAPPERLAVVYPYPTLAEERWRERGNSVERSSLRISPPRILYAGDSQADGFDLLQGALKLLPKPFSLEAFDEDKSKEQFQYCAGLALPYRTDECFSRPAAAAQAAGVKVIAAATGGLPEQIIHGVNGFLAERDQAESLAASLREALIDCEAEEWQAWRVRQNTAEEGDRSRNQLQRLMELMAEGEEEPSLLLEHGAYLRETPGEKSQEQLVDALRAEGDELAMPSAEPQMLRRAHRSSRMGKIELNHAVAYFHGQGCNKIAFGNEVEASVREQFMRWGMDEATAESEAECVYQEAETDAASEAAFRHGRMGRVRAWAISTSNHLILRSLR